LFQLERAEVATQADAAEAWVAAEAVDTTGNCDALGEASAPPIVPIIPAAPAASSGGGESGSTSGDTGSTQSSAAPAPGTWTISYAGTGKGSCLDDAEWTFDFGVDWGADVVPLSLSGSAIILDGSRLNQIQPGVYSGIYTLSNGNSFQLMLTPVSSTLLTGQAILTGQVDGRTCSNTVAVTVTKN
jgi:hypothetical protein